MMEGLEGLKFVTYFQVAPLILMLMTGEMNDVNFRNTKYLFMLYVLLQCWFIWSAFAYKYIQKRYKWCLSKCLFAALLGEMIQFN